MGRSMVPSYYGLFLPIPTLAMYVPSKEIRDAQSYDEDHSVYDYLLHECICAADHGAGIVTRSRTGDCDA